MFRQAVNMAKTAACLIDDSSGYRDDDAAHADYLMTVAKNPQNWRCPCWKMLKND